MSHAKSALASKPDDARPANGDGLGETTPGQGLPRSAALSSPTDQLNRAIIKMLQEDGRLPYKDIATALNVSEGTIRNRVQSMRQSGALKIVALSDPMAIRYQADAMIGIKVASPATPRAGESE